MQKIIGSRLIFFLTTQTVECDQCKAVVSDITGTQENNTTFEVPLAPDLLHTVAKCICTFLLTDLSCHYNISALLLLLIFTFVTSVYTHFVL